MSDTTRIWAGKAVTPITKCPTSYTLTIRVRVPDFPSSTWNNPEFSDFCSCRFPHSHSDVSSEGPAVDGRGLFKAERRNVSSYMLMSVMQDIIDLFKEYAPGLPVYFEVSEVLEATRFRASFLSGHITDLEGKIL